MDTTKPKAGDGSTTWWGEEEEDLSPEEIRARLRRVMRQVRAWSQGPRLRTGPAKGRRHRARQSRRP